MIGRVVGVGQRVRERRPPAREAPPAPAGSRSPALEIFLWSRAAIWAAALLALYWFQPNRHPLADRWDSPVMHDLGSGIDVWARWDSAFFLRIAEHGYEAGSAAFFPLYPLLVAGLGRVLLGHYVLAGVLISLACTLGSFVLLYRAAETRLGADGGRRAVLYLALFPMALFLQAVYSESLFLLLTLAAFLLAERGRWPAAGVVAGLAILTRPAGLALLPPLALLAWRSPSRRRALAGLLPAPLLFLAFPLVLWLQVDDPWAFADAQGIWHRHLSPAGPLGGIWEALTNWIPAGASRAHALAENGEALAFLVLFVALTVVVWRRLGGPYGLFCALSLALPLSVPSDRWPLLSLPRFGLVVFPFFLGLAWLGGRPRLHAAIVGTSALLLGVAVTQWALWQWVA
jgi:hypothetical protein